MENTRLPKCVMFGELMEGRELRGGAGKRMDGVFPGHELTPSSGRLLQSGTREDGARRRKKGRNVSWVT